MRPIIVVALLHAVPAAPAFVGTARAFALRRRSQSCCVAANSAATPIWDAFSSFNVGVVWSGTATMVDPATAVPKATVRYTQRAFAASGSGALRLVTTTTDGGRASETARLKSLDADLDGSYSAEHAAPLEMLALLRQKATDGETDEYEGSDVGDGDTRLLELSLACTDRERRRVLLVYAGGKLTQIVCLLEKRVDGQSADGEGEDAEENAKDADGGAGASQIIPSMTLYSLLGSWVGDACVRTPGQRPSVKAAARGFGKFTKAGPRDAGGKGATSDGELPVRTAVFKARLTYSWDGQKAVARRLGVTSFDGGKLQEIGSVGELCTTSSTFYDHELVRFPTDASLPSILLLPADTYVLAPAILPTGDAEPFPFSTEFGAVLEPGEGFGWKGYQPSEDDKEGDQGEGAPPPDESDANRLVRIQRLYAADGSFASGTTSLCTLE